VDATIAQAYRSETTRIVRQRLAVVALTFVALMGSGVAFEVVTYPERARAVVITWIVESAIMILAAIVSRYAARPGVVGAVAVGCVSLFIAGYHATIAQDPERMAMTLTAFLNGIAVLAPWGPWVQALGAGFTLAATAAATPVFVGSSSPWVLAWIAVGVASVTSIGGAFFLDRYRAEAFRRRPTGRPVPERTRRVPYPRGRGCSSCPIRISAATAISTTSPTASPKRSSSGSAPLISSSSSGTRAWTTTRGDPKLPRCATTWVSVMC
jgi:hypothetical protein